MVCLEDKSPGVLLSPQSTSLKGDVFVGTQLLLLSFHYCHVGKLINIYNNLTTSITTIINSLDLQLPKLQKCANEFSRVLQFVINSFYKKITNFLKSYLIEDDVSSVSTSVDFDKLAYELHIQRKRLQSFDATNFTIIISRQSMVEEFRKIQNVIIQDEYKERVELIDKVTYCTELQSNSYLSTLLSFSYKDKPLPFKQKSIDYILKQSPFSLIEYETLQYFDFLNNVSLLVDIVKVKLEFSTHRLYEEVKSVPHSYYIIVGRAHEFITTHRVYTTNEELQEKYRDIRRLLNNVYNVFNQPCNLKSCQELLQLSKQVESKFIDFCTVFGVERANTFSLWELITYALNTVSQNIQ